ncbi:MAG: tetratricopeptide repeat protein [Planctomycetota bacterium]
MSFSFLLTAGCSLTNGLKSIAKAPGKIFSDNEDDSEKKSSPDRIKHREPKAVYKQPKDKNPNYAIELMRKRKFKEALSILNKYLKNNPLNAEAQSLKGDCLFQLSKFDEAEESYQTARKIDISYYPALLGLGIVKLNKAKEVEKKGSTRETFELYTESYKLLNEAHTILPGNLNAVYGKAHSAAGIGNFFYQRALNLQRIRNDLQGAETMKDKAMALYSEALESATIFSSQYRKDLSARAFVANLHLKSGILHKEFKSEEMSKRAIQNSMLTWKSILLEIDPKNSQAKAEMKRCEKMLKNWNSNLIPSKSSDEVFLDR